MNIIPIENAKLNIIRHADPRVQSYNIEMTELTGGNFWCPYTPGQIDGSEPFPAFTNAGEAMAALLKLMTPFPAIDLYNPRLRNLAAAFGPVIVRYSGGWATMTYYDFDGHTNGKVPQGFEAVMTRAQWQGALDFAKAVGAQILVSVANCPGVHENGTGPWQPDQAKLLWDYTASQGMTIDYAEFMNEPNLPADGHLVPGYGPREYARDHDIFAKWLAENHPETRLVGPCAADNPRSTSAGGAALNAYDTHDLMDGCTILPEIFSYHSYTGISERGAMFGCHHSFDMALDDAYLELTMEDLHYYRKVCDAYMPGADLWVTESAGASCGGNTWEPTFVEAFRYLNELARFNQEAKGVIFHNTLASSAYGLLENETFRPRPQYWAALLFSKLMGTIVYDTKEYLRQGIHLYAQSRKDREEGICWMFLNTSDEEVTLQIPSGECYLLSADHLRAQTVRLNGKTLALNGDELPELAGEYTLGGTCQIPAYTIFFFCSQSGCECPEA